jgi:hypothetical protein
MFDLVIPRGSYSRANGNFPPFTLVNMYAEDTPSAKGGVSLLSFPGLVSSFTRGPGPIQALFRRSDLFGGAIFAVSGSASGTNLYKDATNLGAITATGTVSIASSDIELVVARNSSFAYSYNGTNLTMIAFPDGAGVIAVTFLAGLFVFCRANSQKFYWSAVLDARTVDALDFASAESSPDWLLDCLAIGDVLYLGGKDTIEAWYPTGDGTLPFLRISQRTTAIGVVATGCMVEFDNALHIIGRDRVVYRMEQVLTRISDHGLEEKINASTTFKLFTYRYEGHAFLCVRIDAGTWCFDATTGQWHERRSDGFSNWIVQCACQQSGGTPLFGSATTNDLFSYSGWAEPGTIFAREFTAALPLGESQMIDELEIEANTGVVTDLTLDPVIEMRFSRDRGQTWTPFRETSLGQVGEYRKRVKYRRLGMFDAPGALFHFRTAGPWPFRVSGASGDASSAGRSR